MDYLSGGMKSSACHRLGSPGQALSAGWGHRAKPFFRVPEVIFGRLVLTKPILQKSSFRKGEMAVLLLSGSWPELRIGAKTAAKKSNAYLGPVPGGVTTFWVAAKKRYAYFLMPFFGSCINLILAKNH